MNNKMKLHDAARAAMAQTEETRAWFTTDEINAWAEKKLKENPQWTPDWNTEAVLVEEMQRMAADIEKLKNELQISHQSGYEKGFVDGAQHQMQSSVDKAVNAMGESMAWTDENVIAWCLKRGIEAAKNPPVVNRDEKRIDLSRYAGTYGGTHDNT